MALAFDLWSDSDSPLAWNPQSMKNRPELVFAIIAVLSVVGIVLHGLSLRFRTLATQGALAVAERDMALGTASFKTGDFTSAEAYYVRALEAFPDHPVAQDNLELVRSRISGSVRPRGRFPSLQDPAIVSTNTECAGGTHGGMPGMNALMNAAADFARARARYPSNAFELLDAIAGESSSRLIPGEGLSYTNIVLIPNRRGELVIRWSVTGEHGSAGPYEVIIHGTDP